MSRSFVESTTIGFARALTRAMLSEETARKRGLLQSLDVRVRLIGLLALLLAVTLSRKIAIVAVLFAGALLLGILSRVNLFMLARRVWLIVLGFTGVIAIPALFTTPGRAILSNGTITITEQGLRTAALLVLRVETAVTLTTLLILCTPWAHVLKALRALRLPKEAIMMLAMTYRYVFLLVDTAGQMFESRRSRTVGVLSAREQRQITGRTAGVLLSKSMTLSNEVYSAMESRGFRGDVQILSDDRMTMWDYLGLLLFLAAAALAVWMEDKRMPLFDLRDVSFDYEGIAALRGLSLAIEQGERLALVGANGSGKSTLLRLLDALSFPSAGEIVFDGQKLTAQRLQDDKFALPFRRRVGLVFQNPDVQLFNPTVFDEVAFAPLQLRWPKDELMAKVGTTLELMGISHLHDRPPYRLSGGEKKRVALASVIVLEPDVLLLDEPTATLDPRSQSQIIDLIQQWKGSSHTIVTATHQLEIVEDIADRVVVLEEGKVLASGTPAEILSNQELLLRANLVHAHRHSHGAMTHSHPHIHSHSKHEH